MSRRSDVRLALGYHCVVNLSQNDIQKGKSREDHLRKEEQVFTENPRMKKLPEESWGSERLVAKIAKLQEALVDKNLPKIKKAVEEKIDELEGQLSKLPVQPKTDEERSLRFHQIVAQIRKDLETRVKGECSDRELTIAPKVASMIRAFKEDLKSRNPSWLGRAIIDEVSSMQAAGQGYTVGNLIGPHSHIFINLIKQTFIEEGMLKDCVHEMIMEVGGHLRNVVRHVIQSHASINSKLPIHLDEKAEECIDELTIAAQGDCERLAFAQEETFTTSDQYDFKTRQFRDSWLNLAAEDDCNNLALVLLGVEGQSPKEQTTLQNTLPEEFLELVREAREEPGKQAVLEMCVSLHFYTRFMIDGFVEMSAKLVKFNLVGQLADKLDEVWRKETGRTLQDLFAEEESVVQTRESLQEKMDVLKDFKANHMGILFMSRVADGCALFEKDMIISE